MTKIVGLTGGIGSGKSTIAKLFNQLGIQSIDADDVAREVVLPGEPCLDAIIDAFGEQIILPDGQLNRAKLREEVFQNPESRALLESITHPAIRVRIEDHLNAMTSKYGLLVHPLLFEKHQEHLCDLTIAISVTVAQQVERAMKRDGNNEAQIRRIIQAQLPDEDRIERANFILKNTGTAEDLSGKVTELHKKLLDKLDIK
ncbi:dephospho-CoA kinase [Rhodanobacter aciditrophus]|uniref:Dephospho-CoA kinase n=1 Tax=Rhodanobacter aciditrophus TaxID=1623218 RepID=A0ABW4B1F4_9GAMM